MDEHHTNESGACFFEIGPVDVELDERLVYDSIWRRARDLTLDFRLSTVLAFCCLRASDIDSHRPNSQMMEA